MLNDKNLNQNNIDDELAREILGMVSVDQKMRVKAKVWDYKIDEKNTERLKRIVDKYGWPGRSLVGEEAAHGAWLLAQHADRDLEFQKHALVLLEEAVVGGEADKRDLAYLTDRVRVNNGQSQIFGTQFYENEEGVFGPSPIEDFDNIDRRRAEFGLETFSEYKKTIFEIRSKKK